MIKSRGANQILSIGEGNLLLDHKRPVTNSNASSPFNGGHSDNFQSYDDIPIVRKLTLKTGRGFGIKKKKNNLQNNGFKLLSDFQTYGHDMAGNYQSSKHAICDELLSGLDLYPKQKVREKSKSRHRNSIRGPG